MASKKQKEMLAAGAQAPDFRLRDLSGRQRTRFEISGGKPVLLAFFKVSCPTCQYAFPFLERIYRGRTRQDIAMYAGNEREELSLQSLISQPSPLVGRDRGTRSTPQTMVRVGLAGGI